VPALASSSLPIPRLQPGLAAVSPGRTHWERSRGAGHVLFTVQVDSGRQKSAFPPTSCTPWTART